MFVKDFNKISFILLDNEASRKNYLANQVPLGMLQKEGRDIMIHEQSHRNFMLDNRWELFSPNTQTHKSNHEKNLLKRKFYGLESSHPRLSLIFLCFPGIIQPFRAQFPI